ncbi:hypothetical protein DES49_2599 [Halospina denitrificans]|uniref:Fibronectin type-III domain-containing protein n=1 Tax=Halospina denitrificans TaxID=332522 RepID=A0A4R7JM74_9GAMM|nr:fibronectin type III domain-containing protein [Halospina denitrificans]TDT38616.1 hypothetical protein DES49_2599 [Halospina denitrificans]
MSYPAKKTFKNPTWVLFAGFFILAGCQIDGASDTGSDNGQSAQQDESVTDDTQETASRPSSEDDLVADSSGDSSTTDDESVDDGTTETDGGTTETDGDTTETDGDTTTLDTTATLMWDAPTQRENGDTLKVGSIDYYIVSWGQDPDTLANTEQVSCVNCTDMEHVIEDLDEGTWYFTVQTRDTDGNVSREADLASKKI